jgi:hypothetical protein
MEVDALLISSKDFNRRNFWDWLVSHISGVLPPHRYIGTLVLKNDSIFFAGTDTFLKEDCTFSIRKSEIEQVYHGYDEIYNIWQTRGLGLNWAPVRLKLNYSLPEFDDTIYIISGYNRSGSLNADLFRYLTDWLSR